MAELLSTSPSELERAAAAGKACKLVAFPTESGYAIGTTGLVKAATRRLLQVKERAAPKPFPVLVASAESAKEWGEWTPLSDRLSARWPGPLALLLKPTARGRLLTFPEYPLVALRVPSHPVAAALVAKSGAPWAYTSANKSGEPPLLDAAAVEAALGTELDLIVDGGPAPAGDATLVDASGEKPRVVRDGIFKIEAMA